MHLMTKAFAALFGVGDARECFEGAASTPGSVARMVRPPTRALISVGGPSATIRPRAIEHDAVGVGVGFFEVVRGEDDGFALGRDAANRLPEVAATLDVQGGGGLVQDQHLGVATRAIAMRTRWVWPPGELVGRPIGDIR